MERMEEIIKEVWCGINSVATTLHVLVYTPECKAKWDTEEELIAELRELADYLVEKRR